MIRIERTTFVFLLSLFILCPDNVSAQFTKGKGQFYTTINDSLTVIKKQLIYLATKDIISKELTSMGFDKDSFWEAYQQSLEKKLDILKENLRKQMLSKDKQLIEKYRQAWRKNHLKAKREHGKLLQVLDSYRVGRVIRSSFNPKVYTLKIEGKISRSKLKKIYFQFSPRQSKARTIDKIYWTLDLSLSQENWSDLTIESKEEVVEKLNKVFIDELDRVLGPSKMELIITDISDFEQIQTHTQRSDFDLNILKEGMTRKNQFLNTVWIHLKLNASISWDVFEFNRKSLDSFGDIIVTDLKYNKPIYVKKIEQKRDIIQSIKRSEFAEKITSLIYKRVISEFIPLKQRLKDLPSNLKRNTVEILNYRNYTHLQNIQEILARAGEKYRLKTYLKSFILDRAQLILEYQGSTDHWWSILSKINGRKLQDGSILTMSKGEKSWNITVSPSTEIKEVKHE